MLFVPGISTRECLNGNGSRAYWSDPDLSDCVSAWMSAVDDQVCTLLFSFLCVQYLVGRLVTFLR